MKFTPRDFQENVNISKTSPIKEFFVLTGGILGIIIAVYLILGLALDILVDRMPASTEIRLFGFFSNKFSLNKSYGKAENKAQKILDDLSVDMPTSAFRFRVHIIKNEEENAFALPAGNIVVYTGLLKMIDSENELAMVLAHELGHYVHRDHLRGLGRGLVLTVISVFLFGADSQVTDFFTRVLLTTDFRFSRKQEAFADSFALELLNKKYGQVAGATDFFEHVRKKYKYRSFFKFFSSHPSDTDRINAINKEIILKGHRVGEKISLDSVFVEIRKGED